MANEDQHAGNGKKSGVTTAQRIVDASMELFAQRGYHGTGIRDIAEKADLTTASLYHYMGNKEDLLLHIMREANTRLVAACTKAIEGVENPAVRISLLARVLTVAEATHRLTIVGDTELRVLSPESASEILELRDAHEQQWARAIHDGMLGNCFQIDDERLARFAILQMCTGVAHWYAPEGRLTLDVVATVFGDMALSTLNACDGGHRVSSVYLGLHDAEREIELVAQEFDSFISPRSRPTHLPRSRSPQHTQPLR